MTPKNNTVRSLQHEHAFSERIDRCYPEDYFLELLASERRRYERSGRPFLVMTVDFAGINDLRTRHEAVRAAVQALSLNTRSTDIKGWYRSDEVLCVILTEMHVSGTGALQGKFLHCLQACLSQKWFDLIVIEFHRFPEDGRPDPMDGPLGFTFYPDVARRERARRNGRRIKRIIDVIGSLAAIAVFSPFFILIPIGIKLTSRGPALFRQERVGQYGGKFLFLKFRSMYVNMDQDVHRKFVQNFISRKPSGAADNGAGGKKVYKITKDKRITPFGCFLRKTSLDELPQFFNVLKGEMSLVGPRPPIPYEFEKYDSWHWRRVTDVKPGITGLWQVMGRSSTTFDEMVRLDLQYASNWSLWLDVAILFKTPWAVVSGKGAY